MRHPTLRELEKIAAGLPRGEAAYKDSSDYYNNNISNNMKRIEVLIELLSLESEVLPIGGYGISTSLHNTLLHSAPDFSSGFFSLAFLPLQAEQVL